MSSPENNQKKNRRVSLISHNSNSIDSKQKQVPHENQTGNRRRVTNINPNVKMSDITDVTRQIERSLFDKPKAAQKDYSYKFHCEGEVGGNRDISGMHVEWNATFSKPVEQLIYPSLQRFDWTAYDKRREQQQKLHGHYDSHYSATSTKTPGTGTTTGAPTTLLRQICCDIDKQNPNEEQKMFVHTPKWTVKLSGTGHQNATKYNTAINTRNNTAPHAHVAHPLDAVDHINHDSVADANTGKPIYLSTADEIDIEGEKYLRRRIKEKYLQKIESEAAEKEFIAEMASVQVGPGTRQRQRKKGALNIPIEFETADMLYATIVGKPNSSRNIRLNEQSVPNSQQGSRPGTQGSSYDNAGIGKISVDTAALPSTPETGGRRKLNQLSPEEVVYNNQKKILKDMIPKESDHLLDGLIYYRMHNDLNRAEIEEKKQYEHLKMATISRKVVTKYSNNFTKRLSTRADSNKQTVQKNVNEMHLAAHEDLNLVSTAQLKRIVADSEVNLSRIRRAVGNQKVFKDGHVEVDTPLPLTERPDNKKHKAKLLEDYSYTEEQLNPETRKRQAQDKLLMLQLDAGVLPETFIKPAADANYLTIDLSNYGIGDTRGLCLGGCIASLDRLQSVGLSDNRLTSISIPTIVKNLYCASVMHIDLSFNTIHDQGAKALAIYFKNSKNILSYLDISNCGVTCSDIKIICNALIMNPKCGLCELYLSCNKIAVEGASALCAYLSAKSCKLNTLDLSWNNIAEQGAIEFSVAFCHNTSLCNLNLASNSMNDYGGQRFAKSIGEHRFIKEINLSQNSISNCTCFVVAQVLKGHPSMQKLDLSLNPLGESGAKSIFRTILRGLRCFVIMRDCSYQEDLKIFNNSYPSLDNPYTLDMSEPYLSAVLHELLTKLREDSVNCTFENMTYRETPKSAESQISLVVLNKQVINKATGDVFVPPNTGIYKFNFNQSVFVPQLENAIDVKALDTLQTIIEHGRTENDRKLWLQLLCQDIYFTTTQARAMIKRFIENKTIGSGGLTVLDIIKSLWKFLLDTENMFDFLFENTDADQRRDLLHTLTMKRYKFNWRNPTGHWRLNLEDKVQRSIMMQIIAINNSESEFSKQVANRGDTSQMGNWYNFRNEKYTIDKMTTERTIDKDFIKNVPTSGTIEFDYVSTTRPIFESKKIKPITGSSNALLATNSPRYLNNNTNNANTNDNLTPPNSNRTINTRQPMIPAEIVSDDDFSEFCDKLGLSSRTKVKPAAALFILMDMQLASTKYYFSVKQVHIILDSFADEGDTHSKVIICLFSRIKDLHNLDILLRYLKKKAQQHIISALGCLNILNPLKISFDYILSLKYLDNRILLVSLMELASIESADCISEDPTTELPIATMYGAYTRALNETRPETMKFTYADFGVRTNNVSWSSRRELIKKFLVGTQPIDNDIYSVIMQYKELETAGALSQGPIDLQYGSYQKSLKSTPARTAKTNKQLVGLMKKEASNKSNK